MHINSSRETLVAKIGPGSAPVVKATQRGKMSRPGPQGGRQDENRNVRHESENSDSV